MKKLLLFFLVGLLIFSCTKDKVVLKKEVAQPPPPPPMAYCDSMKQNNVVSWSCEVRAIIHTNCAISSCHADAQIPFFNSYDEVFAQRDRIKERAVVTKTMPPGAPLPDSLIQKLGKWIDDGAKNN